MTAPDGARTVRLPQSRAATVTSVPPPLTQTSTTVSVQPPATRTRTATRTATRRT